MDSVLNLAAANLISPIVLSFVLGLFAALARSDLNFPEAIVKGISLYLLFAIGFKGGVGVTGHGIDLRLFAALLTGVALSFALPFVAYLLLRSMTSLPVVDAAAIAGHYGSISIVTFVAASTLLSGMGTPAEGYMVAVAAAMEAPAIVSALWLAARGSKNGGSMDGRLWREVLLNGVAAFGIVMPLVGAAFGLGAGLALGLSLGGSVLMMVLGASASYIAVPAAMRVALPQANPSISLTLSLGITFPFNITLGIPLYMTMAQALMR